MSDYISKGIVLHRDTWAAFDKLREVHGSYNKALQSVLSGNGVFEPAQPVERSDPSVNVAKLRRDLQRKPLLKPSEKK